MPIWGQLLIVFGGVILALVLIQLLLPIVIKVVVKSRLLPLGFYCLVAWVSTFLTDWTAEHEPLVRLGFYIIAGLTALSWLVSLVKVILAKRSERDMESYVARQLSLARKLNIPADKVTISEDGTVLDAQTDQPIIEERQ